MIDTLQAWDRSAFLFLNGLNSPYWDHFMSLFTSKYIWGVMYASILYVLIRNFEWRMVAFTTLAFVLTITISDQLCSHILRPYFQQLRPSHQPEIMDMVHLINGRRGGLYGFPSCHAANACALTTFIILFFKRKWMSLFFIYWAITTCYTRIYVGVHDPGDVLFGMVVGILPAWGVYLLYRWLLKRPSIRKILQPAFQKQTFDQELNLLASPHKFRHTNIITWTGIITVLVITFYSLFI